MNDDEELIRRAREYLSEKYLDLADVPKFIALLVKLWDKQNTPPKQVTFFWGDD